MGMLADIRQAFRSLLRSPAFTAIALLTMAISIGATAAIFSVVHGILLDPLPYSDPQRLAVVWETDAHNDSWSEGASIPDYLDLKRSARMFESLAAISLRELNLAPRDGAPQRLQALAISHDFFEVIGTRPELGRPFLMEEDRRGAPPVAILSHQLWQDQFGGRPDVLNRTARLDGTEYAIVGVLSSGARLPGNPDVLVPLTPALGDLGESRGVHNAVVWGRLARGATFEAAQHEVSAVMKELEGLYPDDNRGRGARVEPLHEAIVGEVRQPVLLLFGASVLVLLIGCANVAGLLIARGARRGHEIAIRASLGAARWRLLRQLIVESMMLSFAGGSLGIWVAWWGVGALTAIAPSSIPRLENVSIEPAVLGFMVAVSLVSGLSFGIFPALRTSRTALGRSAHGTARGAAAGSSRRLLVVGEIAMAVMLTAGAGLLIRTFVNLARVDPGFQPRGLLTFDISLPEAKYPVPPRSVYPEWPEATRFYEQLLAELAVTPGVESAALAMNHPLRRGWTSTITIEGREPVEGPQDEQRLRAVSPGYFATIGTPVVSGRDLTPDDRYARPAVVLINETFARRYFPDENPIGRSVRFWGVPRTIVGVVGDVRFMGVRERVEPAVYPPLLQVPMTEVAVIVRAGAQPMAHLGAVLHVLERVEPDVAPSNVETLNQILAAAVGPERFQMILLSLFGATALALAAIGVFGLIAYQVEQRRPEIGVRMALGAAGRDIVRMLIGEAGRLAVAGALIGVLGASLLNRYVETMLFSVGSNDPLVLALVAATLILAALVAAWIPARRAATVNPNEVLRNE
jgi:putative ABC transport system permease protein